MNRIVTSFGSAGDHAEELRALARGNAGRRLVEQQDPRLGRERKRDLDQPLLAVREIARERVGVSAEAQHLEQRKRFVGLLALGGAPSDTRRPARPLRSQTASMTDSSTVRPENSVLIWNVRVMPRLTRWCCGERGDPLARRERRRRPMGARAPVRRLMSVVLPAPFGPISAWRAPCGNASETSLFARNAPNDFDRPDVRSAGVIVACRAGARAARRCAPRMPPRANSTTTTSRSPSQNCQ